VRPASSLFASTPPAPEPQEAPSGPSAFAESAPSPRRVLLLRRGQLCCAGVIVALGVVTWLGWIFDLPRWRGVYLDYVPMAPSTASFFILFGLLLAWSARFEGHGHRSHRVAQVVTLALGGTALLLLVLQAIGIKSSFEHFGQTIAGWVGRIAIGYMAPVTAMAFTLASLSSWLLLGKRRQIWARAVAMTAATSIAAIALVALFAYTHEGPLVVDATITPPALNTSLGLLFLALGLMAMAFRRDLKQQRHHLNDALLVTYFLLAAGLFAVGHFNYQGYVQQVKAEGNRELYAVIDLKVQDLERWRKERLADAQVFHGNAHFTQLVAAFLAQPQAPALRQRLWTWLDHVQRAYDYEQVWLADATGLPLLVAPLAPLTEAEICLPEGMRLSDASAPILVDYHLAPGNHKGHMAVLTPLRREGESEPLAYLVFRIDPAAGLWQQVGAWPGLSDSAELLLGSRHKAEMRILNPLRFPAAKDFDMGESLLHQALTADLLTATKQPTLLEGRDYRGVEVIAAVRTVPASPWFLIAKIDREELYAPLEARLWQTIIMIILLLTFSGLLLVAIARQQRARHLRLHLEANAALLASELRFKSLIDNAPVAIFINRNDTIVEANQACLTLFGADTRTQLIGSNPFDRFHPEVHPWVQQCFAAADDEHVAKTSRETKIIRRDGVEVAVELTVAPFAEHALRAHHVVLRDITPLKASLNALKESQEELHQRNAELVRFTYTASHDLKSPLVTIQTFLGYLEQDLAREATEDIAKDLHFIRTAADKMARLLEELLTLSRVGRRIAEEIDAPLRAIVEEALALVAGRLGEAAITLTLPSQAIIVRGDRARLVDLLQNLLDNAVKFMGEQGTPHIEVGAEPQAATLLLWVRDNGMGIEARYLDKVFGLFEKLDAHGDGVGMGLAIVRRIVEVHGGRIWAESAGLGRGTTFFFTLPRDRWSISQTEPPP